MSDEPRFTIISYNIHVVLSTPHVLTSSPYSLATHKPSVVILQEPQDRPPIIDTQNKEVAIHAHQPDYHHSQTMHHYTSTTLPNPQGSYSIFTNHAHTNHYMTSRIAHHTTPERHVP